MKHALYSVFKQLKVKEKKTVSFPPSKFIEYMPPKSNAIESMGCLILAGGQGSRLKVKGPKGCYRLPNGETLFEMLFKKIKAKKQKNLFLAIMTSPLNYDQTVRYLKENNYFGLTSSSISIFSQEMVEVSDQEGNLVFDVNKQAIKSPAGNGGVFDAFYHAGVFEHFKQKGIKYIQVIPVDNPLATPFDEELLGVHETDQVELVLRAIERKDPTEKLGVVEVKNNQLFVCEYTEINPPKEKTLGNTALFSCSMEFIERTVGEKIPWHLAQKGNIWKFEKFIFDFFPMAQSFRVILSDRKKCFSPVKTPL